MWQKNSCQISLHHKLCLQPYASKLCLLKWKTWDVHIRGQISSPAQVFMQFTDNLFGETRLKIWVKILTLVVTDGRHQLCWNWDYIFLVADREITSCFTTLDRKVFVDATATQWLNVFTTNQLRQNMKKSPQSPRLVQDCDDQGTSRELFFLITGREVGQAGVLSLTLGLFCNGFINEPLNLTSSCFP